MMPPTGEKMDSLSSIGDIFAVSAAALGVIMLFGDNELVPVCVTD